MKIKSGFVTRKIGDKIVAVAVGERIKSFNGMITINETGEFIWKCLEKETDIDGIVNKVIKHYDTDEDFARQAVSSFIDELRKNNLLDE
ncbi:PqqD family protein [uncultured Eubacterium sp.]|uniref:PqqD family protein n=1 Tax=uncultured Eubacterium sp. TaxID=165185 RepID=UPI0015AB1633|nr:PqqD family protein [uncultured Eubacterium sp.]